MKKLINTTNNKIEVKIFGKDYTLEPKGELKVSAEVALFWREKLHEFLIEEEWVEEKVEKKELVVEEVKEEEEVEVKEVKKVAKKK